MNIESNMLDIKKYIKQLAEEINSYYSSNIIDDTFTNILIDNYSDMDLPLENKFKLINGEFVKKIDLLKLNNDKYVTEKKAKSFDYSEIKIVYYILKNILSKTKAKYYVLGKAGLNLLYGENVNEIYKSIEIICHINDIDRVRQELKNTNYYIYDNDSINNTEDDYGLSVVINDIPVVINVYEYNTDKMYIKYYYSSTKQTKMKEATINNINSYLKTYMNSNGEKFNIESLDSIYKKLIKENNHNFDEFLKVVRINPNSEEIKFENIEKQINKDREDNNNDDVPTEEEIEEIMKSVEVSEEISKENSNISPEVAETDNKIGEEISNTTNDMEINKEINNIEGLNEKELEDLSNDDSTKNITLSKAETLFLNNRLEKLSLRRKNIINEKKLSDTSSKIMKNNKKDGNLSTRSFVSSMILSLLTGFIAGLTLAISYYWITR